MAIPAITNLKRWRDIGDGPTNYRPCSQQFSDDVVVLIKEYDLAKAEIKRKPRNGV